MLPSTTTKAGSTQAMVHPTIVLRRIPTNSAMNRNHHNRETTIGMRNNPNRAAPTAAVLLGTLHRLAPPLRMVPRRLRSTPADPMIRPALAADPISRPVVHLLQQFQLLLRPFQLLRATRTTTATFFLPFSHLRSLLRRRIQVSRQRPKSLCPTR